MALVLVAVSVILRAQTSPPPQKQADGVDLILLIDQSGSMCGSGVHKGQNDRDNRRNEVLGKILPNVLNSATKGKCYRISVIEFGSRFGSEPRWQAKVTLSAYSIPNRLPKEDESVYQKRVAGELAHFSKPRNKGDSDHDQALQLAQDEIVTLNKTPVAIPMGFSGVEKRLKVLFMLTDGKPYVKKQTTGEVLSDTQLQNSIRQLVNDFPDKEVILFVFGLNASDDYWYGDGYGAFWQNVAASTSDNKGRKGDAQFIANQEQIHTQITKVLGDYTIEPKPDDQVPILNTYDCPPYLKSVTFQIEFPRSYMKPTNALKVMDPNGQVLPDIYFQLFPNYALLKVDAPLHGTWRFERKKGVEVAILPQPEPQTAQYMSPVSPVPLNTTEPVVFKMPDQSAGVPFVPYPTFPVEGQINITRPDNTQQVLNAQFDPKKPGHFISTVPFLFAQLGVYKIEFSGFVVVGSGEKSKVFASALQEITVINTKPVTVRLENPESLSTSFGSFKENLVFGFYVQGQPIAVEEILKAKPSIDAELTLRLSSGKINDSQVIPLKYDGGRLVGDVSGGIPARFFPDLLLGGVKGVLTLKMDGRMLKPDYFLQDPRTLTHLYEFELPVRVSLWLYLFFISLLLGIMAVIAYLLFFKGRAQAYSKDIPILIYRHGDKFNPDPSVEKPIEITKKKMVIKKVKIPFDIPGLSDQWVPEMTITRELIPMGVRIKLKYERFLSNPMDKDRFEEVTLETRDNTNPDQHYIRALELYNMIFQLNIK